VNPAHLFLGTHQDNMDDRNAKGRNRPRRGEGHGMVKLTSAQVRDIRESPLSSGQLTMLYPMVSYAQITRIRGRRSWKHL
jgi:hypothetical protein